MGESKGSETGGEVGLVSLERAGLLGRGPVVAQAVGFHHEAEAGPVEVHPVSVEPLLREGQRQPGGLCDRLEAAFQLGVREGERAVVEEGAELGDTGLPGIAAEGLA